MQHSLNVDQNTAFVLERYAYESSRALTNLQFYADSESPNKDVLERLLDRCIVTSIDNVNLFYTFLNMNLPQVSDAVNLRNDIHTLTFKFNSDSYKE